MSPKVYIIILNWNMAKDTIECVESVKNLNYNNYNILIIDNGSSDNSSQVLKDRFRECEFIQNTDNLGFAEGNNVGMRHALSKGADYVLILNNDVVVEKDCLDQLVKIAQEHKKAGMLAPKVYYYSDRDIINSLGTSIDWFRLRPYSSFCGNKDGGQFDYLGEADILVGCAIFVKKETIEKIGLMDENFFIFHEEADWCLRNIKSGLKNIVVPKAIAYHKASKTMKNFSALTTYYSIRNFLYLAHKNATFIDKIKTGIGLLYLICKNIMSFVFNGKPRRKARAFLSGVVDYYKGNMGKCKRNL